MRLFFKSGCLLFETNFHLKNVIFYRARCVPKVLMLVPCRILQPTSDLMSKVEGLRDRRSKQFNHLSMVAEGVTCLQWVCIDRTPASALSDIMPGSEMYGNKVVMEFKGKDEAQVSFAKDFKLFLVELQKYVKAHHTTGLSWNANGGQGDVDICPCARNRPLTSRTDYFSASAAPAPPKAAPGGPPPPPPPPPPGFFDEKPKAQTSAPGGGAAALFAELNAKGETGVTAGLKKVQL
jgi:adenylyl cyclase-associated protein